MIDLAHLGDWVYEQEAQSDRWRSNAEDRESHRMMRRRRDFELMIGPRPEEVTDEQRLRAWQLADEQPLPDQLTSDDMSAWHSRARYL